MYNFNFLFVISNFSNIRLNIKIASMVFFQAQTHLHFIKLEYVSQQLFKNSFNYVHAILQKLNTTCHLHLLFFFFCRLVSGCSFSKFQPSLFLGSKSSVTPVNFFTLLFSNTFSKSNVGWWYRT